MPKSKGPSSSPFRSPDHGSNRKEMVDEYGGDVESPIKRPRMETPPQASASPRVPTQTPRTAARYGVSHEEVKKISKKATNFKELMAVFAALIAWSQENPDFTDGELGRQVINLFQECNVLSCYAYAHY